MKAALLLAALLFASSPRLFALNVVQYRVHNVWDLLGDRVLAIKRIAVTVAATPSPTQIVVHVDGRVDLLLTAYEPIVNPLPFRFCKDRSIFPR
jgi:hypothetical protein